MPVDATKNIANDKSPLDSCSIFSYVTFWWVSKLVFAGFRRELVEDDVFPLPQRYASNLVLDRFHKEWEYELKAKGRNKASLGKVFLRTFKVRIFITFLLATLAIGVSIIGPLIFLRSAANFYTENEFLLCLSFRIKTYLSPFIFYFLFFIIIIIFLI